MREYVDKKRGRRVIATLRMTRPGESQPDFEVGKRRGEEEREEEGRRRVNWRKSSELCVPAVLAN